MSEKSAYYRREWLNPPGHGNAFVEASVEPGEGNKHSSWFEGGDITIKDCSRQITLSFPMYDNESRENSYRKIAILMNVIENFQGALLVEGEKFQRLQAETKSRAEQLNATATDTSFSVSEDDECTCEFCTRRK